ncbi:GntR family transcriptional repressor for pyruvate dehydrogenase complex [Mariniflexile fucanivorans]|uniref:GntR family transcriptional repressor for pyruvate dehydrogenase complex n=1 Tax=Mariniflexile fucanivorans TaxID=264023 RepID=A0A4V2QD33_9FLAO|nr:FadR/GntR family transcriptional regulator [Mariniflexile fucanivorans]TCL62827.1 GntR family transcriptional repressor for pyruvate dehydrogenase complex [Mariniflexile fucanivorans]
MNLEVLSTNENQSIQNIVIDKIRELINYKNLEPNDKLPSERMLSDKFGVSRGIVRDAIHKLEFYGLLKSIPQSGTFVANVGAIAMNGIVDDILELESPDFKSLVETRILLELKTVKLASLRRTEEDLVSLENALKAFEEKVLNNESAVQEDLLFHLAIAKASKNSTMNTFMLSITPEIITNFEKHHVCNENKSVKGIQEHTAIYEAIKNQNPTLAREKMKIHFKTLYQYCYNVE